MITFLLASIFVIALAIALVCAATILAGREYDAWMEEFNAKGIQTALEPVLSGSEVVGYTVVRQYRDKP